MNGTGDPDAAKVYPLTCHGHSRPVPHLHFSGFQTGSEKFYLISACKDNNPMLRDGVTGDWIGTFIGHKGAVFSSRLSEDATYALTGSADFTAKVWDTHTGECLIDLQHDHVVRAVAFAPGPQVSLVATAGQEKRVNIWDLNSLWPAPTSSNEHVKTMSSRSPLYTLGQGVHNSTIKSIVWGPDPSLLISAEDGMLRWWDVRQQRMANSYRFEGTLGSCELSKTPSGENGGMVSVAAGRSACFFSATAPGQLYKSVKFDTDVTAVGFQPDAGQFVVGLANDTHIRVVDFDKEAQLHLHKGHHGPVWSIDFAPDGKLYATGSEDGTIKLWKFCKGPYGLWK